MKTNLKTFPLKKKNGGLIFLQGWEDNSFRIFYQDVDIWIRDFEVELRSFLTLYENTSILYHKGRKDQIEEILGEIE